MTSRKPLVVIAGPTASGKSALAIARARATGGVIINADASQLYADLSVLTARPDAAALAAAEHRLYGVLDGAEAASAARWAAMARAEISETWDKGRLPILVGGTGLYLKLLLHGMAPVPPIPADLRSTVRALPAEAAHGQLASLDPAMAARLNARDTTRVHRALEVVLATGRSLADWQQETRGGIGDAVALEPVVLEPPRAALYARCDARFGAMLAAGGLDEVRRLAARGLDPSLPVMKAVGVPPLLAHLAGALSLDAAVARARQDTRRYAKRQYTWLRNQVSDWPRLMECLG